MSRQYQPKSILRRVSNPFLKAIFDHEGGLPGVDWETLARTRKNINWIYQLWSALPASNRDKVAEILADVHDMCEHNGSQCLIDTVGRLAPDLMNELREIQSPEDRAARVRLKNPDVFAKALQVARVDELSGKPSWTRRNGLAKGPVAITEVEIHALEKGLSAYFVQNQMRGEDCEIDHFEDGDGSHVFWANLSDYVDTPVIFDQGKLVRKSQQRAFETVLRLDPKCGTLEMTTPGGCKAMEAVYSIACKALLNINVDPSNPIRPTYSLDHVLDSGFALTIDSEDGIESAMVSQVEMRLPDGDLMTLRPSRGNKSWNHLESLQMKLDENRIPVSMIEVRSVTFKFNFYRGSHGKTMTVRVNPNRSTHASEPQARREVAERVLRRSGVLCG